jgi:membrane fusion protein, multidrug efflux system
MADTVDAARLEAGRAEREEPAASRREQGGLRRNAKWILLALLLLVAAGAWVAWRHYSVRESTDDAQIDGHINPISARVGGTVTAVNVDDNQFVKAGTVLVQIDPRDYQVALSRARADLAQSEASARAAETGIPITATMTASRVATAEANVAAARAGLSAAEKEVAAARAQLNAAGARVREAQARSTLAGSNLARMKQLIAKDEISRQQYDASAAEAQAAAAAVESASAAVAQAEQGVPVAESHVAQARAAIAQAEAGVRAAGTGPDEVAVSRAQSGSAVAKIGQNRAAVEQAELNLAYTTVKAPVDGVVSRKGVETGQVVQAGQPLLAIVPLEEIWVTANFKETQLKNMRPGQPATVYVDTYGGREYRGHVDSIAAATGARFSLLPPENASGNYVKVVQRVPVKIVFEKGQEPGRLLRPGMSVVPTVLTQ